MKITAVRAAWLRASIPAARAHVSDFGRNDSFNTCLVEIDTDEGLVGVGEAKVGVGNLGNYAGVVALVHAELGAMYPVSGGTSGKESVSTRTRVGTWMLGRTRRTSACR